MPRAIAVIERQIRLRERLVQKGLINHEHLFLQRVGSTDPGCEVPVRALTAFTPPARHSLSQALNGAPYFGELESDDRPQPVVGRQGARSPTPDALLSVYARGRKALSKRTPQPFAGQ